MHASTARRNAALPGYACLPKRATSLQNRHEAVLVTDRWGSRKIAVKWGGCAALLQYRHVLIELTGGATQRQHPQALHLLLIGLTI
jgi:hypothetical protein